MASAKPERPSQAHRATSRFKKEQRALGARLRPEAEVGPAGQIAGEASGGVSGHGSEGQEQEAEDQPVHSTCLRSNL